MLLEQITKDLEKATRIQDPLVLMTIRFILSEIHYAEIDKQRKLTDEEVIVVLQKEVKKRNEAIELMKRGNRMELVEEELKKIEVIKKYLPTQLSDEEISTIVKQAREKMPQAQMGQLIGAVMGQVKGKADGSRVALLVKKELGI